ncbi:hypothetical protein Ddye_021181 [Dipteronia dyeriana]|uniref:Uncharacterized protein n=1 Tax=Dipteronia dyeriana TaxID=168575 RepID=A0AAD9U168_9ROSI|nr:hypothetical protein Ddye_021181 [Dipteronia dyeriana]
MNITFWNGVTTCLKVFAPLVRVLRLVNGDRKPSMGLLYGELKKAKEKINLTLKINDNSYRPITDIIDNEAKDQLDTPLHLMAYLLNPFYLYEDPSIITDEGSFGKRKKRLKDNELNIDVLLASDDDASNAQGWTVDDGDERVEPCSVLSSQMVDEAIVVDGITQPQRSAKVQKPEKPL